MGRRKKKNKDAVPKIAWFAFGGVGLFILMALLSVHDSRFKPFVLAAWGLFFLLAVVYSIRTMIELRKPRYCPVCQIRLKLDYLGHMFTSVVNETLKAKCPHCGFVEDTGIRLPEAG